MKERPILFSSPMVRAILEGRKTQTRRVIHKMPHTLPGWWKAMHWASAGHFIKGVAEHCPYGQPGDRLWVREAWRVGAWDEENGQIAVDYRADNHARREWLEVTEDDEGETFNRLWEQSCHDASAAGRQLNVQNRYKWKPGESPCRWHPSIHMYRWASRLTLEVTGVRVERVQEITEPDAIAEGVEQYVTGPHWTQDRYRPSYGNYILDSHSEISGL